MTSLSSIEIERIKPHVSNIRRDLGDLSELAASIKGMGLLQPLTVAPNGDDYLVIAGHRRLAAAKEAGLDVVPCIIRTDLSTQKAQIEAMLVENLQRSDLTVMEEADAYAQLELLGVKEAAIAKATGRSKATVHQRLLLAGLPTKRRQEFETGKLSLEAAVMCAKLRAQHGDDAGILELIDKAPNWKFTSSYGLKYDIERLLESRTSKPEPVDQDADDDESCAPAGQTTMDSQIREHQREAERERLHDMWNRQAEWLTERLAHVADEESLGVLAIAAVNEALNQDELDTDAADAAGIERDLDEDGNWSADFTSPEALLYCILAATPINIDPAASAWISTYSITQRVRWLTALGYKPSDAEAALLPQRDSE